MNSKTAKILRKFAKIAHLPYTNIKNIFQSQSKQQQEVHLLLMKEKIAKYKELQVEVNQKLGKGGDK